MRASKLVQTLILGAALALPGSAAHATQNAPYPGTVAIDTTLRFATLVKRVQQAVRAQRMGIVAQASASRGAAARGVTIPGNAVIMVFRNDYAVRMLAASVAAGIEAPLRLYVTETAAGARLTYRKPSAVFAPYGSAKLDAMAKELDDVFQRIAGGATAR